MHRIDHSLTREPRSAGVLLHPTSLPGARGIGCLGSEAHRFLDFLVRARQRLWQVCPLGPTGYGDSPYQCFSAFAGNPMLIDLASLGRDGLLEPNELSDCPAPVGPVDYGAVIPWKTERLRLAFDRFCALAPPSERARLDRFGTLNRRWLDDYATFMAAKEAYGGRPWTEWDPPLRDRDPVALREFADEHAGRIAFSRFLQWVFHVQWFAVRAAAGAHGVRIIGDLPIFAAHDSADVWAHRELFELDEVGLPAVMAGVPPDYFSETGQLWGNPVYRWDEHRRTAFAWWAEVLSNKFTLHDHVRIDHFRGFSAYWAVPAGETTAIRGEWIPAPGRELFASLEERLGRLPVIAEDLGVITPDVVALIEHFGFARMKVLQFAFDSAEQNDYLPHTYERNAVVYTGTHDNDTVMGWYEKADGTDRAFAREYLGAPADSAIAWEFIRAAHASTAQFSVVPVQDLLELGSDARMNTPGIAGGNWRYRVADGELTDRLADRLARLTGLYGRA